jgi:hypothetical protein
MLLANKPLPHPRKSLMPTVIRITFSKMKPKIKRIKSNTIKQKPLEISQKPPPLPSVEQGTSLLKAKTSRVLGGSINPRTTPESRFHFL